ncbi:hypothetical protein EVAR_14004_1 [Eumeta japonica]|uniref:Uncharacterized protein n=1 Tax=Eumeta variegata TaxID=151549 RepID=A0A4C1XB96_EUMVA|nr:hypothetical protein EVAR_14004_1 [Eumeta japonica]
MNHRARIDSTPRHSPRVMFRAPLTLGGACARARCVPEGRVNIVIYSIFERETSRWTMRKKIAMNTRKPREVISALPATWEGIGYTVREDRIDEAEEWRVDHRNSYSLDENLEVARREERECCECCEGFWRVVCGTTSLRTTSQPVRGTLRHERNYVQ